ncbi:MAG: hypothetical protein K2M12_07225 [Muribaculaceae bacterium]|nr:hypothetical protein [Muribaculaceae bacterium]
MNARIEYFLNAVFYCLSRWCAGFYLKLQYATFRVLGAFLKPFMSGERWRKMQEAVNNIGPVLYSNSNRRKTEYFSYSYNLMASLIGCYISWFFLGAILVGGYLGRMNIYVILIIAIVFTCLCYFPIWRWVFRKDKGAAYFKKFDRRVDAWYGKWKRITAIFCAGAVLSLIISIVIFVLILSGR